MAVRSSYMSNSLLHMHARKRTRKGALIRHAEGTHCHGFALRVTRKRIRRKPLRIHFRTFLTALCALRSRETYISRYNHFAPYGVANYTFLQKLYSQRLRSWSWGASRNFYAQLLPLLLPVASS